jgi:PAS domain S-box-containing protein
MDNNTSIAKGALGACGCFSIISDRSQEAIAVLDTKGVVHYTNAAWVRMHGFEKRSEIVGKRISDFHNKEQISEYILPFLQEVGQRGQIGGIVGHMRKNGTTVPTSTTMVALKDETGRMRAVIVFATDISELEQLKEDIRALKGEAEKRTAELTSSVAQLEERAKELKIVESLLGARGTELSSVNKKLWQYMAEIEQSHEQVQALKATLVEKDKEMAELRSQLQRQNAERMRQEQHWKT